MTRIIGGTAGGRRLRTPAGDGTRPTSDRVREAMFSAIESARGPLAGVRFLDLYAGSGAVGLEALSRGASAVTLVERDRRTAALIRDNASTLGFSADVRTSTVARALAHPPRAPYSVVFLDPPYSLGTDDIVADLRALREHDWLTGAAMVIVERSSRGPELPWPEGCAAQRSRRYGETTLWYGHAAGPGRIADGEPDEESRG